MLRPSAKDEFAQAAANMVVRFARKEGVVASFELEASGNKTSFERVAGKKKEDTTPAAPEWDDYAFDTPNWPGFRGYLSRGVIENQNLPDEWDVESGKNVAWKAAIPGLGLSCPIAWGDAVFVSTAVAVDDPPEGSQLQTGLYGNVDSVEDDREYAFKLFKLSLSTGKVLWERECVTAKPAVKRHTKSSFANPTPVTNGEFVVTHFGTEGLFCHTMSGDLVWKKDFGFLDSGWFFDRSFQWGFGASPYIHDGIVYLQCDIQDQSFLVALDVKTGDEKWRTNRDDIPTWSSPVAYKDPSGGLRVALNGTREAAVYDGADGKRIWSLAGMSEIVVPTPQVTPNYLLLASGYRPIRPVIAVAHDAAGEFSVTEDKSTAKKDDEGESNKKPDTEDSGPFVWKLDSGGSYLPTPVVYRGYVYVVSNNGVLACHDATTGKRLSRVRLKGAGSCTGSPIAADGKLYITSETGRTFVVPVGPKQEPLGKNEVGEAVLTTPAIAGGRLLIRGENHLFAISRTEKPAAE